MLSFILIYIEKSRKYDTIITFEDVPCLTIFENKKQGEFNMNKINVRFIAESAIIAALYAALTWLFAPIAYGSIQFRLSEVLVLLVLFKPKYAYALILGCFISNTTSSLGVWDMVFGTLATALAVIPMMKIKNIYVASIFPVITNSIIVSIELYFALGIEPIWLSALTVGIGEAVVLYLVGIPVMISIANNEGLVEYLEFENNIKSTKFFNLTNSLALALGAVGIILFIAYPCTIDHTLLDLISSNYWLIVFIVFPIMYVVLFLFTKHIARLILTIIVAMLPLFLMGAFIDGTVLISFFIGYAIYTILLIALSIFDFKINIRKSED